MSVSELPHKGAAPAGGPTAALIIIGAEVLNGKVADANGPYLLAALRARGVEVLEVRTIGDSIAAIGEAVRQLAARVDYVFTTGGIGPTHDDVTMAGVAAAFATHVVYDAALLAAVTARYVARGSDPATMPPAHRRLAEVPQGASVTLGAGQHVPVVQMRNVIILAGVPSLMRDAFTHIAHKFTGQAFCSAGLYLVVHESHIAAMLTEVQRDFADVAIGSYPRFDRGKSEVRITIDGRDAGRVAAATAALHAQLPTAVRADLAWPP
jgi:molybdenum cofactor synthesis domain-containing protein